MNLSQRMSSVKPSATVAVTEKAAALRAKGIEVIDLGAGEPDFDTAPHICKAAELAIQHGQTRYTPVAGSLELRRAIVEKLRRENGLAYDTSEVLASCGGKHSLYLAFHCLFGSGDEVIVPAPCWVSYVDMLALAGARARIVKASMEAGFKLIPAELAAAITPHTRAIVLNSPSNPAGVTYEEAEVAAIADVLARHDLTIICDDVYEMIVYDKIERSHILLHRPELRERTIVINSVSKTYAMTGWRIGYAAGPSAVIKGMSTLQGQMTGNPCSIAQAAALAALAGPQEQVAPMVREFERRRNFVVERLNAMKGVVCPRPQGAFYVFPNVARLLNPEKGVRSGDDLAAFLLDEGRVAMVGGTDFGYPDHIRISYANSMEKLQMGLERMEMALGRLS